MQSQAQPPDDFVTAVLLTFDPQLPAGGVKAAAQQYCDSIRNSPDGWRLCLQKLHEVALARGSDHVKFWCLLTIHETTERRYQAMNEEEQTVLRRSLMLFVRDVIPTVPQSSFIKNKLCTIMVKIVKHDYPKIWPTFFNDFLGLLEKGPEVIDVFVRLLKILDEEVVDTTDTQRGALEHRHNTLIKDSMRERDLASIVDAMYSICSLYHQTHPALVAAALESFSEYIGWIDINLVVNERFLALFYALMAPPNAGTAAAGIVKQLALAPGTSSPSFGPQSPSRSSGGSGSVSSNSVQLIALQTAASDCLIEIIEKRMDDKLKKLAMIKQLRVLDFLSNVLLPTHTAPLFPLEASQASQPWAQTPLDKFCATIASLIQSIGSQLIECVEKLNKLANNSSLTPPQLQEATSAFAEALPMLEKVLHLGYRFFEHPLYVVSGEMLTLYGEYVSLLKRAGPWTAGSAEHLRRIFYALSISMAYPAWYNFAQADDEEANFNEHRTACMKLFTNVTLTNPSLMVDMMAARLAETLQGLAALPYVTVEVTLKLLYEVALPLKANQRTAEEPFRSMIGSLLSSSVSSHPHPQISLVYFDLVVRYVKFLDQNPTFLGPVLSSFLDQRGMRHTNATVRNRSCYLFFKCLTTPDLQKKQLAPFVDETLKQIQTVIESVLGPSALTGSAALIDPFACCCLCDSMGLLVSSAVTGNDNCHRYVQLAFHFFRKQLESAVQAQAAWYPHDQERAGLRLGQLIEGVSYISKQLSPDGARIEDLMLDMAQIILQVLTILPQHQAVVAKALFFTHRMVDCQPHLTAAQQTTLTAGAAPTAAAAPSPPAPIQQYFSLTLQLLLKHANASSILGITNLIIQIMIKFKKRFEGVLDQVFLPMCTKIFECLATYAHVDAPQITPASNGTSSAPLPAAAYSTEKQDRLLLQQRYYEFLKSIVTYDLVNVFASPTNARHIRSVLDTILSGCVSPPDFSIHRACFTLLRQLVTIWSAGGVIADPALKHFIRVEVTTRLFKALCMPHFDLGDPACIAAVRELIELQKAIVKCLGEEYLNYLHTDFLQAMLGFTPQVAQEYCLALMNYNAHNNQAGSEWKVFQPFFTALKAKNAQLQ